MKAEHMQEAVKRFDAFESVTAKLPSDIEDQAGLLRYLADLQTRQAELGEAVITLRRSVGLTEEVMAPLYESIEEHENALGELSNPATEDLFGMYGEGYRLGVFTGVVIALIAAREAGEYEPSNTE